MIDPCLGHLIGYFRDDLSTRGRHTARYRERATASKSISRVGGSEANHYHHTHRPCSRQWGFQIRSNCIDMTLLGDFGSDNGYQNERVYAKSPPLESGRHSSSALSRSSSERPPQARWNTEASNGNEKKVTRRFTCYSLAENMDGF
ncbi:hypothetical protein CI102_8049 [Trichoderma harzianum]|nr:hypothetical protein CI102_8049 [Trichoderma harzianum]